MENPWVGQQQARTLVWEYLRGWKFGKKIQCPCLLFGHLVDFWFPTRRLAICFFDGLDSRKTRKFEAFFKRNGVTLIHFNEVDVEREPHEAVAVIFGFLGEDF